MIGKKRAFRRAAGAAVIITMLSFAVLWVSGCSSKQHVYRVGVLSGLDFFYEIVNDFKERMAELGYIEGTNIVYDIQKSNVDLDTYKTIMQKFIADTVDLIFAFPTEAAQIATQLTRETDIPVVFANVFTEGTGLIDSVQAPGGNSTGVRWVGPDMALQRFEIMRALLPRAKRMWVPYLKDYSIVDSQLVALRKACENAGVTLTEIPVTDVTELKDTLARLATGPQGVPDAILHIAEPISIMPDAEAVVGGFAKQHDVPVGGAYYLVDGYESMFGLIPQSGPQARQVAFLADKILKGAQAGSLPVVSAECFFQISYRAAQKMGVTVDEGLLSRADKVIR